MRRWVGLTTSCKRSHPMHERRSPARSSRGPSARRTRQQHDPIRFGRLWRVRVRVADVPRAGRPSGPSARHQGRARWGLAFGTPMQARNPHAKQEFRRPTDPLQPPPTPPTSAAASSAPGLALLALYEIKRPLNARSDHRTPLGPMDASRPSQRPHALGGHRPSRRRSHRTLVGGASSDATYPSSAAPSPDRDSPQP